MALTTITPKKLLKVIIIKVSKGSLINWVSRENRLVLEQLAQTTGAGKDKIIILVIDRAGWHTSQQVVVPQGIILEPLPPYSPELQPAERLWCLTDEPLANKTFDSLEELEEILLDRCQILSSMESEIKNLTFYHWWPDANNLEIPSP